MKVYYRLAIKALFMLSLLFFNMSCSEEPGSSTTERTPIQLPGNTRAASEGLLDFSFNFTKAMAAVMDVKGEGVPDNSVGSPLSAAYVLALLANFSDPGTSQDITAAFGTTDKVSMNELFKILNTQLPVADARTKVNIANSFWGNASKLNNQVAAVYDVIREYYNSEIFFSNFSHDNNSSLNAINGWCNDKTGNKGVEYLTTLPEDAFAIVLNALHFKGIWAKEYFDVNKTKNDVFKGVQGDRKVKMMYGSRILGYYNEDDYFKFCSIDFGNRAFSIELVVPKNPNIDVVSVTELLDLERFRYLSENAIESKINLTLPKFTIETSQDLNPVYVEMGMATACFPRYLDFGAQKVDGCLIYNQSLQFGVDEFGSETKVITSGIAAETALDPNKQDIKSVVVDRPFFFFIQEYSTKACILSGRITQL